MRMRLGQVAALALMLSAFSSPLWAETPVVPEDRVILNLVAEDWVNTSTARVVLGVDASVSAANAGNARAEMMTAVQDVLKADWRLTGFSRNQDSTGMEKWSATFETRVPENKLNGLGEAAKKRSRAGMQVNVAAVDFSPTVEEIQKGYSALRAKLYKDAKEQLSVLNGTLNDRAYRIALIDFTQSEEPVAAPQPVRPRMAMLAAKMATNEMVAAGADSAMEKAEKISMTAHLVFATAPKESGTK